MNLFDFIVEEYGVPEEDHKLIQNQLDRWKVESEKQMYKKFPPYLLEPYMKQIERDTNRYNNLGRKIGG